MKAYFGVQLNYVGRIARFAGWYGGHRPPVRAELLTLTPTGSGYCMSDLPVFQRGNHSGSEHDAAAD